MKYITFILGLLCCGLLNGQIKPHLEQIPKNKASKYQLEDLQLNESALPALPLNPDMAVFKPRYNYSAIRSLAKPAMVGKQLKVITSPKTGIPVLIKGNLNYPMQTFAGKSNLENECLSFLDAAKEILQVEQVDQAFAFTAVNPGAEGWQHVRIQQQVEGIPIYGAEAVLHLQNGKVKSLTGRTVPQPGISDLTTIVTEPEALEMVKTDLIGHTSVVRLEGQSLSLVGGSQHLTELVIYHKGRDILQEHLAWKIEFAPNIASRWLYFIDAQTGEILHKHNQICQLHPHDHLEELLPPDGPAVANATDLQGITRTINTYEKDGIFFMIDASRPMHNEFQSDFPDDAVGVIWTIDAENTSPQNNNFSTIHITSGNNVWNNPTAVSAHYNAGQAYEYFRSTFNRNSINGQGGNIISLINVSDENNQDMDNAFWNGFAMFYGNGDQAFVSPLAKSLDVAAHELSHGVIQNTANLEYFGESGALNESFADVFAVMVDRDDWQLGEDIVNTGIFSTGALRDLANPNNGGSSLNTPGWQPDHVNEQFQGSQDNGGVHINSGITNKAFFLFASQVGKNTAEQVYYEALTNYLVRSSQFIDLRIAVLEVAATYNNSVVNAAASAFDQVGITSGTPTDPEEEVGSNPGQEFILYTDGNFGSLNIVTPEGDEVANPLTNVGPLSKPSITDDGSIIVYIDQNKTMRVIYIDWAAGNAEIDFLSTDPVWRNVAISKDGTRIAALTDDFDNRLFVFDLINGGSEEYELTNPTYAEGVETGDVEFADVLEWDFSGEFVMYDALNRIDNATSTIEYWDIGFVKVWNNATNNFGSGFISKLFSGLPEDSSVGNPTFSKNSPFIIGLDFIDSFNDEYYIIGANIETGEVGTVFQNSGLGYPNYSVSDDRMIFDALDQFDDRVIGIIDLAEDKINGQGQATVFISEFSEARWGVWFANGERDLTSIEDLERIGIQFEIFPNPVADRLRVELTLDKAVPVLVEVYDLLGQRHFQLKENLLAGPQQVEINLQDLAAGSYFVKLSSNNLTATRKFLKLK